MLVMMLQNSIFFFAAASEKQRMNETVSAAWAAVMATQTPFCRWNALMDR